MIMSFQMKNNMPEFSEMLTNMFTGKKPAAVQGSAGAGGSKQSKKRN